MKSVLEMVQKKRSTLGFEVRVWEYAAWDTAYKDAGGPEKALQVFNDCIWYNSTNRESGELVCEFVEAQTNVKRLETPVLNADGEPTKTKDGEAIVKAETGGKYIKRALRTSGKTIAELQTGLDLFLATQNEGQGLVLDASPGSRKAKGPNAEAMVWAQSRMAAPDLLAKFHRTYKDATGKTLELPNDLALKPQAIAWAYLEAVAALAAKKL